MVLRWSNGLVLALSVALVATAGCSLAQSSGDAASQAKKTIAEAAASHLAGATANESAEAADGTPAPTDEEEASRGLFAGVDEQEPTEAMEESPEVATAASENEHTAAYHDQELAARDAKIHELTQRIAALETEIAGMQSTIASFSSALASLQDPDEFSRQALGAMAEDGDLRAGFGEMLQGKVRLVNNTGESRVVYINGTAWTVVTGESYIYAPVGTVSFLLEGEMEPTFKGVQEWTASDTAGRFELEYQLGGDSTESSVLQDLPGR